MNALEWYSSHKLLLNRKYEGHYIAIVNCKVVSVGTTITEVLAKASATYNHANITIVYAGDDNTL